MIPPGMNARSQRQPEPELMDLPHEVSAYAQADFKDVNTRFVDRLLELTRHLESAQAIDLGCGPGEIAIMVARRCPTWRVVAADASQPMLDVARDTIRSANITTINLKRVDAKSTGLPSASFDVVFSNSLLHHVTDALAMWREFGRLTKAGGTIFLRDLARPGSDSEAARIVREHAGNGSPVLQEEFHRSLLAAYTVDEVRDQLRRANLDQLQVAMISDRHLDVFGTTRS